MKGNSVLTVGFKTVSHIFPDFSNSINKSLNLKLKPYIKFDKQLPEFERDFQQQHSQWNKFFLENKRCWSGLSAYDNYLFYGEDSLGRSQNMTLLPSSYQCIHMVPEICKGKNKRNLGVGIFSVHVELFAFLSYML